MPWPVNCGRNFEMQSSNIFGPTEYKRGTSAFRNPGEMELLNREIDFRFPDIRSDSEISRQGESVSDDTLSEL